MALKAYSCATQQPTLHYNCMKPSINLAALYSKYVMPLDPVFRCFLLYSSLSRLRWPLPSIICFPMRGRSNTLRPPNFPAFRRSLESLERHAPRWSLPRSRLLQGLRSRHLGLLRTHRHISLPFLFGATVLGFLLFGIVSTSALPRYAEVSASTPFWSPWRGSSPEQFKFNWWQEHWPTTRRNSAISMIRTRESATDWYQAQRRLPDRQCSL